MFVRSFLSGDDSHYNNLWTTVVWGGIEEGNWENRIHIVLKFRVIRVDFCHSGTGSVIGLVFMKGSVEMWNWISSISSFIQFIHRHTQATSGSGPTHQPVHQIHRIHGKSAKSNPSAAPNANHLILKFIHNANCLLKRFSKHFRLNRLNPSAVRVLCASFILAQTSTQVTD